MKTRRHVPGAVWRALLCAPLAALVYAAAASSTREFSDAHAARAGRPAHTRGARRQGDDRVDIRLRSLTTRATGKLTIEPSETGGRGRLTALNLPDPRTVTAGARTYVVWAVSGGRILRLGELKLDARGNGGLAFGRPEGFERYGVIVTAESSAEVERPGDPVLTTRADEAGALFPAPTDTAARADSGNAPAPVDTDKPNATAATDRPNAPAATATPEATTTPESTPAPERSDAPVNRATPNATPDTSGGARATSNPRASSNRVGGGVSAPPPTPSRGGAARGAFYSEVEDAIAASGGGRVIEMEGDGAAARAGGAARAA
jgi:hypothetical protein